MITSECDAELKTIAQNVIDYRSRSYVADAMTLARHTLTSLEERKSVRELAARVAAGEAPVLELLDRLR